MGSCGVAEAAGPQRLSLRPTASGVSALGRDRRSSWRRARGVPQLHTSADAPCQWAAPSRPSDPGPGGPVSSGSQLPQSLLTGSGREGPWGPGIKETRRSTDWDSGSWEMHGEYLDRGEPHRGLLRSPSHGPAFRVFDIVIYYMHLMVVHRPARASSDHPDRPVRPGTRAGESESHIGYQPPLVAFPLPQLHHTWRAPARHPVGPICKLPSCASLKSLPLKGDKLPVGLTQSDTVRVSLAWPFDSGLRPG